MFLVEYDQWYFIFLDSKWVNSNEEEEDNEEKPNEDANKSEGEGEGEEEEEEVESKNNKVKNEEEEEVKRIVLEEMEHVVELRVPLIADCGEGANWLEAH